MGTLRGLRRAIPPIDPSPHAQTCCLHVTTRIQRLLLLRVGEAKRHHR
jgi:hypothetical protein